MCACLHYHTVYTHACSDALTQESQTDSCTHVHAWAHAHTHTHIHTYTQTRTHTHTHTHTLNFLQSLRKVLQALGGLCALINLYNLLPCNLCQSNLYTTVQQSHSQLHLSQLVLLCYKLLLPQQPKFSSVHFVHLCRSIYYSLLTGLPKNFIEILQRIGNSAARFVFKSLFLSACSCTLASLQFLV